MPELDLNYRGPMKWLFVFVALLAPVTASGQDEPVKVPEEVNVFVKKGTAPIALESGDLNGDGRKDLILVVSETIPDGERYEEGAGDRTVMVLIREAGGSLTLAARNDLVAYCRNCGGVYGDPFAGVTVRGTRFTVSNYGGSNSRWSFSSTFAYSRRDRTWQLVRVEEESFHALDPRRTMRRRVYTPPNDFGLITFADFDPDTFRRKGKK